MRVLVLLTESFGGRGGIAQYNRDFLSALCSFPGCSEVVAIPRLITPITEALPKKLQYIHAKSEKKMDYVRAVFRILRCKPSFDLVICGHVNLLLLAFTARWITKAKLILLIYGIDAWQATGNPITNRLVQTIDALISISEVTKTRFLSWAKVANNISFILPNAIHLRDYGVADKNQMLLTKHDLHGKKVLMTLGRLSSSERYKGVDEVLQVLPKLCDQVPDICYVIAGDGDDRARLESKAHTLKIAKHVIFTGYVPEELKADYYRVADVYVMPGRGEGFGFVFLEAMACGVPVVASTLDGSREAVRNGELGFAVNPDDTEQLQQRILDSLRLGKRIPDGLSYFSYDKFKSRLANILKATVSV